MMTLLPFAVLVSLLICVATLTAMVLRSRAFGKRALHAAPVATATRGIVFAFGTGMLPWEKESARRHLFTYLAGIIYHVGVFTAAGYVSWRLVFGAPAGGSALLTVFLLPGVAAGVFLLLKRLFVRNMRRLSVPDDYISNLLVNYLLAASAVDAVTGTFTPGLYLAVILLLIYIPLGKIRHCVFFFYARYLLGRFHGRRGTWPKPDLNEDAS
ncbi:MAG: hypothetical protein JXQ27_01945 [Acidobacteria bacterium]|nr:hypothetical protein [Acidobacteriota bacterium]